MKMINTNECERCKYGVIDDSNRAKVLVICQAKNKQYYYGQCIPCEYMEKRNKNEGSENSECIES